MNQYLIGILFGGSLITSLGALSTYTVENKQPTMKSVTRDFIIGSILFVLIMQLLPESSTYLLSFLTSLIPFVSALPVSDELELQVGVPTF